MEISRILIQKSHNFAKSVVFGLVILLRFSELRKCHIKMCEQEFEIAWIDLVIFFTRNIEKHRDARLNI